MADSESKYREGDWCPECGAEKPDHLPTCFGLPPHERHVGGGDAVPLDYRVPGKCRECGREQVFVVSLSSAGPVELIRSSEVDSAILYQCDNCDEIAVEVLG